MSNTKTIRPNRNLKILLARFSAEQPQRGEVYQANVSHDAWCPALVQARNSDQGSV